MEAKDIHEALAEETMEHIRKAYSQYLSSNPGGESQAVHSFTSALTRLLRLSNHIQADLDETLEQGHEDKQLADKRRQELKTREERSAKEARDAEAHPPGKQEGPQPPPKR